jgi:multidrug efflux pump subunit AcrA (membrane-fusion protein)
MATFRKYTSRILFGAAAVAIVGGAVYLGYRRSLANAAAAVAPPPTVVVSSGLVVLSVTVPGLVVDTGAVTVVSPVNGQVDEIAIQPGQAITHGQVLARLGNRQSFEAAAAAGRLEVLQAQQALDQLEAGALQAAAEAQQRLAQAEKDLETDQRQLAGLTRPDLPAYQQQLAAAQSALVTAQENAQITAMGGLTLTLQSARQALQTSTNIYHDALAAQGQCPGCTRVFAPAAGMEVNLADAKAQMEQAANSVQVLELQLAQAQRADSAAVQQQQAQVAVAQANLARAQAHSPMAADLALAQANVALAQARVNSARAAWQRLKDGPDLASLALDQAGLANAQNNLAAAEANLACLDVRAPFDGVVLAVSAAPGQSVAAGMALMTITRAGSLEVQATVVEQDYPLVAPGQPVQLFFDALSGANVTGRVTRVVPQRSSNTQALYPIAIQLDSLPEHLAAGMTADGSIIIARLDGVLRLPRAVAHAHSDGSAEVQVWANGQATTRTIQVGLRGDSFVEVTGGLQEGELVVAQ